jgi:Fur family ferric uptake transcriptional regulator
MTSSVEILKNHKLRITPFRVEVLDIFAKAEFALTMGDIENKLVGFDKVTLYRTLKSFEEKGVIHKALDGTNHPKFAICEAHCQEHHHYDEHVHFHCLKCENTFCVESVFIPEVTMPDGFKVKQTDIIVSGVCEKCVLGADATLKSPFDK